MVFLWWWHDPCLVVDCDLSIVRTDSLTWNMHRNNPKHTIVSMWNLNVQDPEDLTCVSTIYYNPTLFFAVSKDWNLTPKTLSLTSVHFKDLLHFHTENRFFQSLEGCSVEILPSRTSTVKRGEAISLAGQIGWRDQYIWKSDLMLSEQWDRLLFPAQINSTPANKFTINWSVG